MENSNIMITIQNKINFILDQLVDKIKFIFLDRISFIVNGRQEMFTEQDLKEAEKIVGDSFDSILEPYIQENFLDNLSETQINLCYELIATEEGQTLLKSLNKLHQGSIDNIFNIIEDLQKRNSEKEENNFTIDPGYLFSLDKDEELLN